MDIGYVLQRETLGGTYMKQNASLSPETVRVSAASDDAQSNSATTQPLDKTKLADRIQQWNGHLAESQYAVEFDVRPHAGHAWINIVDKKSGKIVYEVPAENVRRMMQANVDNTCGLAFDAIR